MRTPPRDASVLDNDPPTSALLEEGDENLAEGMGAVKVFCGDCGYVLLLDAEAVGIWGLWDRFRRP